MHEKFEAIYKASQTVTILTSEITVANTIIMEVWILQELSECERQAKCEQMLLEKMVPFRVTVDTGLPETVCKKCCICKIAIRSEACIKSVSEPVLTGVPSPQGLFQMCIIEIFLLFNDTNIFVPLNVTKSKLALLTAQQTSESESWSVETRNTTLFSKSTDWRWQTNVSTVLWSLDARFLYGSEMRKQSKDH